MNGWVLGQGGFELNRDKEVLEQLTIVDDVYLVDSTIRSLQSGVSGSRHTADDLVEIGRTLDLLGVRELIVNLSWKDGVETARGLAASRPSARIVGTFRARHKGWREWFDAGVEAGVDEICFESVWDRRQLEAMAATARDARVRYSHGFAEAYGLQDVIDLTRLAGELGYASVSYHDSFFRLGITPDAMRVFLRRLRAAAPQHPPLYVHLSNFYGHATLTGVAAVTAGASAVDVCLNATGHHCGHASLAEIAIVLADLYGIDTGIRLDRLTAAIEEINRRTGVPLPLTQPIIGSHAFLGDGAYWAAEAHLPQGERIHARFPFPPDVVGARERIVWSERTANPEAVEAKLVRMGLPTDPGLVAACLLRLAQELGTKAAYPNWLSDEEFEAIARGRAADAAEGGPR